MDRETIIQAWVDYCKTVLSEEWTVTREEQDTGLDAPRPNGPYITLKIISGPMNKSIGRLTQFNGNCEGHKNFNICDQVQYVMSVKSFRSGHAEALDDIKSGFLDPDIAEILKDKAKISVQNNPNILDISARLETGYEQRSQMDIVFNSVQNRETNIGLIETVTITGKIETESGKEITTNLPDITKE